MRRDISACDDGDDEDGGQVGSRAYISSKTYIYIVFLSLTPSDVHSPPSRDVSHDVMRFHVRSAIRLGPPAGEVRERPGTGEVRIRRIDQHGAIRSSVVVVRMVVVATVRRR